MLKKLSHLAADKREALIVGAIGLLLFTLGLWHQEFIGFETRFAVFGKEMLRTGLSFFPRTYGEPYPDYPATSTLLIWLCSLPFGEVTKLSAVLPTAFFSAINLALTYYLLRSVSAQWAFLAVCFELLTVTFLAEARAISLDQMIATITLACFVLLYKQSVASTHTWKKVFGLLALGFFIRGPMGIVLPAGVICSFLVINTRWRTLFIFGASSVALIAACWFVLLALARHTGGDAFEQAVVHMQVAGRLSGNETPPPHSYYFVNSVGNFALSFPFALVALVVVVKTAWPYLSIPRLKPARYREWDPTLKLATMMAGWLIVMLVGLSIPETKKARYLLPAVPAMAALASVAFISRRSRVLAVMYQVMQKLLLILPLLLLALACYAPHYAKQHHLALKVSLTPALVAFTVLSVAQIVLWLRVRDANNRERYLAAVAVLSLWSGTVLLKEPVEIQLHSARPFVEQAEALRQQQPAPLVMYRISQDSIAIVYHVNVAGEFKPQFIQQPEQLNQLAYPLYLLVGDKNITGLQSAATAAHRLEWPLPILQGWFREDTYTLYYLERSPL